MVNPDSATRESASRRIVFYFDFGSPNAYLAYKLIPSIERRIGPAFDLRPALLGGIFKATGNQSPAVTLARVPAKRAYERREMERFIERHGLHAFRFNPHFPIHTLQLMRGTVVAQQLGCFERYVDAVFVAMWERELDLGKPEIFEDVVTAAGLPAAQLLAQLADPEVKQALVARTEEAVARGVFGSPTFFVGDEMFFGKDKLREVEEEFVQQAARGS
jgi:2-hydroxychromene-2-carboxylate isomerase